MLERSARKAEQEPGEVHDLLFLPILIFWELVMMEFAQLMEIIGNKAFPILCCIVLFWSQYKERERHSEEIKNMTSAINNNTMAINELRGLLQHASN